MLNYETQWMDRDAIVYSTYEAGKRLNRLKARYGLIDPKAADAVEARIEGAVRMMKEIDRIMAIPEGGERERLLDLFFEKDPPVDTYSLSTVCEKRELEWPTRFIRMNIFKIVKTILTRRQSNVRDPSSAASAKDSARR